MKIQNVIAVLIAVISISTTSLTNAEAQTIASLSANTLARSGRLKITGSGFGAARGAVQIGGVAAPVSSWSDTSITAYVSEAAPLGQAGAQVVTAAGAGSNSVPLNVTARSVSTERVRWRFQVDAQYINGRPAVGADGTIYTADTRGHLYALTPDGGLKWIFNAPTLSNFVQNAVDVGADGTIYFATTFNIYAVNPNGTLKWTVRDPSVARVEAGPNVGPDGNIYAVTNDQNNAGGLGLTVISPAGQILRNRPGYTESNDAGLLNDRQIVFGQQNQLHFTLDYVDGVNFGLQFYELGGNFRFARNPATIRFNPAVAPDGTVYVVKFSPQQFESRGLSGYDPNGNLVRTFPALESNVNLSSPDVGADGTIYIWRDYSLAAAFDPNGTQRWQITTPQAFIRQDPAVNPQNTVVVFAGVGISSQPGFVLGASNTGQTLFTLILPQENGGQIAPSARPKFSADGATAYVGMSLASTAPDVYTYLYAVRAAAPPPTVAAPKTPFDFDGDGKADVSVFRPSNGVWFLNQSTGGFTGLQFGLSTDKLVPADYDGDGKTDVAVYRNGTWYLQRSQAGFAGFAFGASEDVPVPADYDGDGKSEIAVFRPSNGTWYFYNLANNQSNALQFGLAGDKPVAADYDGDGKSDVAVFRSGTWYLQRSQLGFTGSAFGESADNPVAADYDGDGKADIAVFRPGNGIWYLHQSATGFKGVQFGLGTDTPTPADYDGDGKTDIAVVRDGIWYLLGSQQGFAAVHFGATNDKPIPTAFIR